MTLASFFAIFAFLVLAPGMVQAQWNPNTSVNLLLSSFTDDVQLAAPTTDGKTWISFYSQTSGNYAMRAQLLDANGYKLLGPDGIMVSNQPSGSATFVYNICLDASNNLIIAMQDTRTGSMKTCLYKIDQAGNHLWSPDGVVLGAGLAPNPTVLTTGETVVCWDESVSGTLNLQKISVAGATVWATPIQVKVGTTKTTRGQIVANSGGKFTMLIQRKGVGIYSTLWAQAFDNSGTALYSPVQLATPASSASRYYSVLSDADTTYFGYYVAAGSRFNSFLQRLNPDGTIPWGINGSNFNTAVGSTDNYQMVTDINMQPGSNYIYSVVNICNTLQSQYGIYVQKFLKTTGARQFTDAAKVVYPISTARDQHIDRIAMITDGPMFMGYSDVDYKIYVVRLDASGNFVWPGNKVEISSTTAAPGVPKMRYGFTPIGPTRCAGVWTENRASGGYKGYAQGISIGGLTGIKVYTQGNVPATIVAPMGTLQMVDTITPLTANQNVTWSIVPGTGVALMSTGGLVTAITNGTVWAKAVSVLDNTVKDSLMITMTNQNITAPSVITLAATSVAGTTAVLNGSVNANNASTVVTFSYGLTTAYGTTLTATPSPVLGNSPTPVLVNIVGLIPGTTYHFRVSGTNIAGTTNGNDLTFTTPLIPPTVITNAATDVLNTSAQLHGTIVANNAQTAVSFDWGITAAYGNNIPATPVSVSGMTSTPVLADIGSLIWGTTYHYRCVGINSAGTANGADMTFTTGCPSIPAPGAISGPTSICRSSTNIVYSVPDIPNTTYYNWTLPAGVSIVAGLGTSAITVDFTSSSVSGNISVNGTNNCTAGSATSIAVTVNPLPDPVITGSSVLCANSGYYTYTTQAGMSGYTWTVSSGGFIYSGSGTSAITVVWNSAGAQTVGVNYANAFGCQALTPVLFNVTVNDVPAAAGSITGTNALCSGTQGVPYTMAAITGAPTYVWILPTGAAIATGEGTNSISVNYGANATSGTITAYGNNLCGNGASSNLSVTVNPIPPAPVITASGYVLTSNAAAGNQWYHDGTAVAGATDQTYTVPASASGWYWTIVTLNACSSDTSNHKYIMGVGIGEHNPGVVTIHPVPSDGHFSITINSEKEISYKLDIYNSLGVKVYGERTITVTGTMVTPVDLSSVPGGLYTLILRNGDNQITRKIIINK